MPASVSNTYLLVLPVPFFRLDDDRFATESAFVGHLHLLRESLRDCVEHLVVAAPFVDQERYAALAPGWSIVSEAKDNISYVPLYPVTQGRLRYFLGLPRTVWRLLRAVGRAAFVHAGPSTLYRPCENVALFLGWLRRRRTVFVIDIDQRATARMELATGRFTRGQYLRTVWLHDLWQSVQLRLATWLATVVMLKGRQLVADYGKGRRNVHYILDAAHDASMVLAPAELAARKTELAGPARSLRAVYFGRIVAYKGIDRMLAAVALARQRGADVTLDLYGGGEHERELRQQVAAAGLQECVHFHGMRPYGLPFLREVGAFDVLLACPLSEDTPRSAIDAQARGLPVLAFDTYYYKELQRDGGGVTCVPWPDVDALAAELVSLAADRGRLVQLAEAGVQFAAANTQEDWLGRRAEWTLAGMPQRSGATG